MMVRWPPVACAHTILIALRRFIFCAFAQIILTSF